MHREVAINGFPFNGMVPVVKARGDHECFHPSWKRPRHVGMNEDRVYRHEHQIRIQRSGVEAENKEWHKGEAAREHDVHHVQS